MTFQPHPRAQEVVRDYQAGLPLKTIAHRYDMTPQAACRIAIGAGCRSRRSQKARRAMARAAKQREAAQ